MTREALCEHPVVTFLDVWVSPNISDAAVWEWGLWGCFVFMCSVQQGSSCQEHECLSSYMHGLMTSAEQVGSGCVTGNVAAQLLCVTEASTLVCSEINTMYFVFFC